MTGGLSNFEQVMVYRGTLATIEAGTLMGLWWVLGRLMPNGRVGNWAMHAWNPRVLFDLVGASHNDAAMLLLLLTGVAVILHPNDLPKRASTWVVGLLAMTLGALLKYATGVGTSSVRPTAPRATSPAPREKPSQKKVGAYKLAPPATARKGPNLLIRRTAATTS